MVRRSSPAFSPGRGGVFIPMGRGSGLGSKLSTRLPHDLGASIDAPAGRGLSGSGFGASGAASGPGVWGPGGVGGVGGVGGLASGRGRRGVVVKARCHWQRRHVMGRRWDVRRARAALLLGTAIVCV